MHERALANIVERFREFRAAVIAQGSPRGFTISLRDDTPRRIITAGDMTLVLAGASLDAFERFRSKWERKEWVGKWSERFREAKLNAALGEAWSASDDGAAVFNALASEFDAPVPRYTLWFPVYGITMHVHEFRVGTVRVRGVTPEIVTEWKRMVRGIMESSPNTEDQRKAYADWTDGFLGELAGGVCLEVQGEGDDDQAVAVAEDACEPVVDYLQLVAGIFEEPSKRIRIAFRTFAPSGYRNVLAISQDGTHFVPSKKSFGPLGQLALNEERLAKLEEYGFGGVHEILSKPPDDRTEIEEFIMRSIHWFANGEMQNEIENRLQSYVTCIDMFFTTPNSEVTSAVREGFALVMGEGVEQRRYLNSFLGEMYEYRSRASHSGERLDVVSKVAELRYLVINFIAVMLKRRTDFADKKALREWLTDQKFGGGDEGASVPNGG